MIPVHPHVIPCVGEVRRKVLVFPSVGAIDLWIVTHVIYTSVFVNPTMLLNRMLEAIHPCYGIEYIGSKNMPQIV